MNSFSRYYRKARAMPPRTLARKAVGKTRGCIATWLRKIKSRFLSTYVSDRRFVAALEDSFGSVEEFLTHIATRRTPRFFTDSDAKVTVLRALKNDCSVTIERTMAQADTICTHTFDLLGSGDTHLGHPINWHSDFKAGYRWDPKTYYTDIAYMDLDQSYDVKVPWELSRCQHFAWLGQAYWSTGDEKYTREFVAQVLAWIEQNPPQFGVNWACTMDVAIRVVNWLWGYYFFKDSPCLTDEFRLVFWKSLLVHGRHIMGNLEWSEALTGNHYLSDIVGLVYLGILCPEFKEAAKWQDFGLQELWKEMSKQVHPDGADFEASISYHRLVTELFLSPIILCQLNDIPVPNEVMERLEKMIEFVMHYTKPDGTAPLIGDADNGRLHRLKVWAEPEREWIDHRYLLAIGSVLFRRDDFAQAAGEHWEEAFWLLGERAIAYKEQLAQNNLPLLESRCFPDGGLYIMRHNDLYMIIDAGDNGQNGYGG
ncbi:MAG TPA: hypothetical protein EYP49_05210, partial [Anaerolineae bacterium]|nr:hypothetical protein [Anaerolineae bacterium]